MPKISAATLDQHRAEVTDRLLDAFGELVLSRGYAEVSLADVASAAGLARTAIYTYFPNRESLLFAWTDREVRNTIERLELEVAEAGSYAEKLRVFVRHQLAEFSTRHLPPGREVIQFLKPETYERFMNHIEPLERILRNIVERGVEAKEFADVDPASTVSLVMACIGSERVPLATGIHEAGEAEERLSNFLLRALARPGGRPKRRTRSPSRPLA
ncbi:MAG: TetR/AcrR family transcriptional regulator [Actinomycetota bacterium]|jgi:AcrR family transcriptional regulator